MTSSNTQFKLGKISEQFTQLSEEVINLLNQRDGVYKQISNRIESNLHDLHNRSTIKLTFIGQYSSGKSTIISALTGNREIKIDADIATDRSTEYMWNGITITDTPGLYTDRTDHDVVTYEAIRLSDLLIFVITSDLFDDIILNNFNKLAYEEGYLHKMKLVVNKMSMEPGDFEELKENYLDSLADSFHPHSISEFDISFIDAADYLEGIDGNRTEYIEMSHFDDFIYQLNNFVDKKGLLGKLDTPFRIVLSEIDQALIEVGANTDDKVYFALLNRIESRVKKSLGHVESQLSWIVGELRSKIVALGSSLSGKIGLTNEDFNEEVNKTESLIPKLVNEMSEQFEAILVEEQKQLTEEIKNIMEGDLGETYLQQIQQKSKNISVENVHVNDKNVVITQFETVSSIVDKASGGFLKLTLGEGTKQSGLFFSSSAVAGSTLHKGVYTVGKFFGHSFKPWQAVNIATKLSNFLRAVGPILSIATAVMDMVKIGKENADLQKVMKAKQECMSNFIEIAGFT